MRLSCQEHLLPGATLQQQWDLAQMLGFDAVELRGAGEYGLRARLPELRRAVQRGLVVSSVCVAMDHFIGDFDPVRSRDAVDNLRSQLSVAAELGAEGVVTPASWGMFSRRLPPFEPPRSAGEDRAVLLAALDELGAHAESEGVRLFLEPLNRYEDHMVNTVSAAAELCAAAGTNGLAVCADTYHMNIEEADPCAALRDVAPWLGIVQVSDSNRLEPGAGHVDWAAQLATLDAIGYHGTLSWECRLSGEPRAALLRSTGLLRRFLRAEAA